MKNAMKLTVAVLALVAALALVACGSSDSGTTSGTATETSGAESEKPAGKGADVPTIEVRNGEPVGGIQTLEFSAGEEVRFRVSSDEAEEIHVHGYDIAKDVPAGGTIEFDFPAELEGIYEAELEGQGVQIAELRINP
jgi:major membrane immunogen (membrane-anchored lipoprotein)